MSNWYQRWAKPWLFKQDPEWIHHATLTALAYAGHSDTIRDCLSDLSAVPSLPISVMGLGFQNPIGLAAGMDKNAIAVPAWEALGLGFSEIGGVTQYPQPGNPKPRLFRAPETNAIINRMGFNNLGADAIRTNLAKTKRSPKNPLGINLGKSKRTPLPQAQEDFAYSFKTLWSLGDFFVVNVSSPNTPGLRELQDKESLRTILQHLQDTNQQLARASTSTDSPKPLLVKIAPDLTLSAIDDVLSLVLELGLSGIVATNTTIDRPTPPHGAPPTVYQETGGLSGGPLRERSTAIIRHLAKQTQGKVTLIGVGGIDSAASAWEKFAAGASLCQVYSGLIFQGPGLVPATVSGIIQQLQHHGLKQLQDAIGSQLPFVP